VRRRGFRELSSLRYDVVVHSNVLIISLEKQGVKDHTSSLSRTHIPKRAAAIAQKRRYATDTEIAEIYGVSVLTLRKWRLFGRGPRFYKIGRSVKYDIDEVERYVRSTGSVRAGRNDYSRSSKEEQP
jgi:hypothetical protein